MKMTLKQWGNSLALRIPKVFAVELGLVTENEVDVFLEDNKIVVAKKSHQSLESMLDRITPDMLHEETNTGITTGSEAW